MVSKYLSYLSALLIGLCECGVIDYYYTPGNPLIGVLRYKDHFFCFSSKDAALKFAADPDR